MNKVFVISIISLVFLCCKENVDIEKQNELADLSEQIFKQKRIDSRKMLDLIEKKTTSNFPDSLNFTQIYADKSANTFFKIYESPKGIINFMSYYRDNKEIYTAEYYSNGIVKCLFNFARDGIKNGKYECYYENGKIHSRGEYKNDKPIGLEIEYDTIGNITYQYEYK